MNRSIFFLLFAPLALIFSQLQAEILLDEVMSKEDQQKTGVKYLKREQKIALEQWLDQNFVLKTHAKVPEQKLSLSINIDNGQKIRLSDNSLWEIAPNDVSIAAVWITPFPIKIMPSNDQDYPCLLVNADTGVSVKARQISPSAPNPNC
jgi:hypothetical protein